MNRPLSPTQRRALLAMPVRNGRGCWHEWQASCQRFSTARVLAREGLVETPDGGWSIPRWFIRLTSEGVAAQAALMKARSAALAWLIESDGDLLWALLTVSTAPQGRRSVTAIATGITCGGSGKDLRQPQAVSS